MAIHELRNVVPLEGLSQGRMAVGEEGVMTPNETDTVL